jgi:SAM-dependent methyltransferase
LSSRADAAACPVCLGSRAGHFLSVRGRDYWRCETCAATFLDRSQLPDRESESARYRQHRNDDADPDYRSFLRRLADPLLACLTPGRTGLDYGCGPSPALAEMFIAAGHAVRLYDPLFLPDASALEPTYDFITCAEVVEHFHRPAEEFARLDRLLKPGGRLGIMTRLLADDRGFADSHYRRDPTHVVFYKDETLRHIAARFDWQCDLPAPDIALMQRPASASSVSGRQPSPRSS